MLSRGGIHCDWIETNTKVPEGANVGEWMVLMPWQLNFIYPIYNGRDGCTPEQEQEALLMQLLKYDVPALKLSLQVASEQEGRELQFKTALEQGRSGWRLGILAANICQHRSLELRPHQFAPCHITFEDEPQPLKGMEEAAALVRKLVAAKVSRLHPDPAAAYKKATGKSLIE